MFEAMTNPKAKVLRVEHGLRVFDLGATRISLGTFERLRPARARSR